MLFRSLGRQANLVNVKANLRAQTPWFMLPLRNKLLHSFRVIPDRGSWLEVQFDTADLLYIYLDRRKRRRKFLRAKKSKRFAMPWVKPWRKTKPC